VRWCLRWRRLLRGMAATALPSQALKTMWKSAYRNKGTGNHNKGTGNHNKGTDNHNKGTDNHNKGTDNT
jgi:hypothetical protein